MERLARSGLFPRTNFHGLRHSAASVLLDHGAELHEVKEQLGHSSITLTSNTYGHIFDAGKRELAALQDRAYAGPESNVTPLRKANPGA